MCTSLPARSLSALAILSGLAPARISRLITTLSCARSTRRTIASQAPLAPGTAAPVLVEQVERGPKWNMSERPERVAGTVTPWRPSAAMLSCSRSRGWCSIFGRSMCRTTRLMSLIVPEPG